MWQAWIFLALTIIFWGAAPILEKYGLRYTDEFTAVFIRSTAVFFVLLLTLTFTNKKQLLCKLSLKPVLIFTLSGILAGLLGMWTYFKFLKLNPSSKAVPLSATYPLITVMLSIVFLGETISWQRALGTVLIILGVILVK